MVLNNPPYTPSKNLSKTITFTGAAGAGAVGQVTVATPTGLVYVRKIIPRSVTLPVSAGAATLSLGRAASVAALIAATAFDQLVAGRYWLNNAPAATLLALPAALQGFLLGGPITMDVAVADITLGAIGFDIEYDSIGGGTLS